MNFPRCECAFQPLCASCYTVQLCFSRHWTVRLKMFIFCACFLMYVLCENYYKPITVQSYKADCVRWVPRLTVGLMNKLDLGMCPWNGTCLYSGDLRYSGWPSSDVPEPPVHRGLCFHSVSVNTMAPHGPHLSDEEMGLHLPKATQWWVGEYGGW